MLGDNNVAYNCLKHLSSYTVYFFHKPRVCSIQYSALSSILAFHTKHAVSVEFNWLLFFK